MFSNEFFADPLSLPRHQHLRLLVQTVSQRTDGRAVYLMSKSDISQFAAGRKPSALMTIEPDRFGFLFITDENLDKLGNKGVECDWQTGDNTPVEHRLSPDDAREQAMIYAGGLHNHRDRRFG